MNTILHWDKPARKMTVAAWKGITADSAPPGTYTPNMSKADMVKWKAKLIGGTDPRVEIRKSCQWDNGKKYPAMVSHGCQISITVRKASNDVGPQVRISMNGTAGMTLSDAWDLNEAIKEAVVALL